MLSEIWLQFFFTRVHLICDDSLFSSSCSLSCLISFLISFSSNFKIPRFTKVQSKSLLGILLLTIILIGMYTASKKINQNTDMSTYPKLHSSKRTRPSNATYIDANSANTHTTESLIESSSTQSSKHCPPADNSGRWRKVSNLCYVFGAYIDTRPVSMIFLHIFIDMNRIKGFQ